MSKNRCMEEKKNPTRMYFANLKKIAFKKVVQNKEFLHFWKR